MLNFQDIKFGEMVPGTGPIRVKWDAASRNGIEAIGKTHPSLFGLLRLPELSSKDLQHVLP